MDKRRAYKNSNSSEAIPIRKFNTVEMNKRRAYKNSNSSEAIHVKELKLPIVGEREKIAKSVANTIIKEAIESVVSSEVVVELVN